MMVIRTTIHHGRWEILQLPYHIMMLENEFLVVLYSTMLAKKVCCYSKKTYYFYICKGHKSLAFCKDIVDSQMAMTLLLKMGKSLHIFSAKCGARGRSRDCGLSGQTCTLCDCATITSYTMNVCPFKTFFKYLIKSSFYSSRKQVPNKSSAYGPYGSESPLTCYYLLLNDALTETHFTR